MTGNLAKLKLLAQASPVRFLLVKDSFAVVAASQVELLYVVVLYKLMIATLWQVVH
jgi:hypothetical protein